MSGMHNSISLRVLVSHFELENFRLIVIDSNFDLLSILTESIPLLTFDERDLISQLIDFAFAYIESNQRMALFCIISQNMEIQS